MRKNTRPPVRRQVRNFILWLRACPLWKKPRPRRVGTVGPIVFFADENGVVHSNEGELFPTTDSP